GEVMKMLRPVITRSIVLETDAEPGLATVDADPAQIQQVLTNLMINARDALPDGGTIHISIENVPLDSSFWGRHPGSEPGPYVRLRVADNGIGMDQATKNRIFEPFFTTKSGNKGSGLGLSVVHGIVASHQGMIEVDSAAGQGTAISVYLPAAAAEVSIAPAGSVPTLGNDELVLVIDDDAAVTQAARQALEHTGYRVLAAQNAPEAIALIRTRGRDVDAVLLDLTMPEISGRDVFAALRALRRDLPVIFSSGQSSAKLDAELLTPHTAFVAKPYTQNELTETLARLLATTRAGGADQ
ncbi:MAG: hypothetical protein RLZZ387_4731, partial [Chloroflexota bacterium]